MYLFKYNYPQVDQNTGIFCLIQIKDVQGHVYLDGQIMMVSKTEVKEAELNHEV